MGFFDSIKKAVTTVAPPMTAPPATQDDPEEMHAEEEASDGAHDDGHEDHEDDGGHDTAGFDPANDEDSFFRAVQHMESEGLMGGTDESRAEIMATYGIRDRRHWQDVRDACYQVLAQKYGSFEEASQREMNYRQKISTQYMGNQIAAKAATGEMAPVEGISLESWAATNAALVSGTNLADLLRGQGVTQAAWDKASAEWNARMSRDTTFAIAQVYGAAFQNASKGKYGDLAREATSARAENRDLKLPLPMTIEQYFELVCENSIACRQGTDPQAALKALGLTVVDWTDLGVFMGYHIERSHMSVYKGKTGEIMEKVKQAVEAKHPGIKADVDISF
jgi:hypothetical protein